MKPIAFCSAINKENLIEFLLDFLYYLYNYYMVCALSSHTYHVTSHVMLCDVTVICDTFLHSFLCSKSKGKRKVKVK